MWFTYDISQNSIDNYHHISEDEPDDNNEYNTEEDNEEGNDYYYPKTEEEFKSINEAINKQLEEKNRPFVSWLISKCCFDINDSIEKLEKCILKKPYYSIYLKFSKKPDSDLSYCQKCGQAIDWCEKVKND